MKSYKKSECCPKCKQPDPWVFYKGAHVVCDFDILQLKCRRCAYQWNRRPADVTPEQEAKRIKAYASPEAVAARRVRMFYDRYSGSGSGARRY